MKKKNFINVMLSFLKVGTIGFGGGAALIPVIEDELVTKNKWMEAEEFDRSVAVSSISPASLPVSLCSMWNSKYSLLSAYSYALPGPLIYLILLTGFSLIGEQGMNYVRFASVGLLAFVMVLLYQFVMKNYKNAVITGFKIHYLLIVLVSFLLTCGSALRRMSNRLFDFPEAYWPSFITSVNIVILMLSTFFIVCFMGSSKSKLKLCVALLVSGVFVAFASLGDVLINKTGLTSDVVRVTIGSIGVVRVIIGRIGAVGAIIGVIGVVMLVMAVGSIVYDMIMNKEKKTKRKKFKPDYKPLRNVVLFVVIAIVLVASVHLVSGERGVWEYSGKVVTSSLQSFGGGEVFYGIAEEVFVEPGFTDRVFYDEQVAAIAGAMPGPVLVSIVTGIGFEYGNRVGGVGFGWMFGLMSLALAVTATAFGALSLFFGFEVLKDSIRMQMIIRYIIPVVCGLLVSTAVALMTSAATVLRGEGLLHIASIGVVLGLALLILILRKKYRVKDVFLLLAGGLGTLTTLGVINHFVS